MFKRFTQSLVAWAFVHAPMLARLWVRRHALGTEPPFARLAIALSSVTLGLVTTGGVHHREQVPFRRKSESSVGDGSYRILDLRRPREHFVITHDWYDHRDAEADLNLVLPVERLNELAQEKVIHALHPVAVGLMGHVEAKEERRLEFETAPVLVRLFRQEKVDAVLLVPA